MKQLFFTLALVTMLIVGAASVTATDDLITCDNALQYFDGSALYVHGEECTCPFEAQEGRTIVYFDDERLLSNAGPAAAITDVYSASLNEGVYKITLVASDGYDWRNTVYQPHEQWHVLFGNGQMSASVSDLPDYINYVSVIETVDTAFVLNDAIDDLQGEHSYYPMWPANSVVPVCAVFDEVPQNDVPEFGVLAALAALGVAGFFIYRKRK